MPEVSTTIPTPNPSERALLIQFDESVIAANPDFIPVEGTTYRNFPEGLIARSYPVELWGDYIYTSPMGDHGLLFAKPKTPEQAITPWRRQWSKFGNHRWHPILKNLILIENPSFPRSTNFIQNGQQGFATAPSYDDRYVYIPDVNEGTRFFTEEFQAPTQYVIPRYRTPVPTGVQYSVGDLRGAFQECLHDDIEIPATRSSNAIYLGGAAYSGNGSVEGQVFPRTNFKTWLPYVIYDEQELTNGVWYRKRIRVFPPARPRAIRRA